jgi:hypothetical protein
MTDGTPPPPNPYGAAPVGGNPDQIRGTGKSILFAIITFGIYELVWVYKTSNERKNYSGTDSVVGSRCCCSSSSPSSWCS